MKMTIFLSYLTCLVILPLNNKAINCVLILYRFPSKLNITKREFSYSKLLFYIGNQTYIFTTMISEFSLWTEKDLQHFALF
jgi:hypothetical protein